MIPCSNYMYVKINVLSVASVTGQYKDSITLCSSHNTKQDVVKICEHNKRCEDNKQLCIIYRS